MILKDTTWIYKTKKWRGFKTGMDSEQLYIDKVGV